jgi:hypothetical protein
MSDPVDDALAAARQAMAITVPDGAADRAIAAALAAPAQPRATWWSAAFPILWRAAAIVDVAAIAAVIIALALPGPAPAPQRPATPSPEDALFADETSAVLAQALRLSPNQEQTP